VDWGWPYRWWIGGGHAGWSRREACQYSGTHYGWPQLNGTQGQPGAGKSRLVVPMVHACTEPCSYKTRYSCDQKLSCSQAGHTFDASPESVLGAALLDNIRLESARARAHMGDERGLANRNRAIMGVQWTAIDYRMASTGSD
jgi:hypothetical protein